MTKRCDFVVCINIMYFLESSFVVKNQINSFSIARIIVSNETNI